MSCRRPRPGALALGILATVLAGAGTAQEGPRLRATHTLPEMPLKEVLQQLRKAVASDRGVRLAGGSDLWHGPGEPRDEFWMLTDRGPNGLVDVGGALRRTFLVPEFTPSILRVRAAGETLSVLQVLPIAGSSGRPVTGLPNVEGHDETGYDATGTSKLAFDPSGLDTEGLVRTRNGQFWLADEYGPSLVHVDGSGRVIERFVPEGRRIPGADYPVAAVLPEVYARRKENRGFEGLALSADETRLYAALQSPLLHPDRKTGDASRQARILCFDPKAGRPVAEYVYRFEPAAEFDPRTPGKPADMKISSLVALDGDTLLVLERTDAVAKVYAATMPAGADILGTRWDDPAHAPGLESLADPAAAGVKVLQKRLVADLTALPGVPGKIEGLAALDDRTLAFCNDNDFDVGTIDAAGNNVGTGARSRLWVIVLGGPLPRSIVDGHR